ncbi:MAG: hypothetical protein WC460_06730 [Patescibacteria group bacterium]
MKKLSEILNEQRALGDDVDSWMGYVGIDYISDCEEKIPYMISDLKDVVNRLSKAYKETKNIKYNSQLKNLRKVINDLDSAHKTLTEFIMEYWKENTTE